MKYIITQYYTTEHTELYNLTSPINKKYAEKIGVNYIDNNEKRCQDRKVWWEKIAWLIELTNKVENMGAYIIYEDCDSINIGGDVRTALNSDSYYGMVQLRGGLGNNQLLNWFNAGVIILINTPEVRQFLKKVWDRNDDTDETSINKELKINSNIINSKLITSIDPKWNCWSNNEQHCTEICIKSWHGMKYNNKLNDIKKFINNG